MVQKKIDYFCRYCGKKISNYNVGFCDRDCQSNFKEMEIKFKEINQKKKVAGLEKANRNFEVKVRISVEERNKIEQKSKELGLRLSPYMRMISLYGIQIPSQVLL